MEVTVENFPTRECDKRGQSVGITYEKVCHRAPERKYADKVVRMASYCRHHTDRTYIPDPYYEGREGFELVLNMLEDGCQELLEVIKNKINSGS